MVENYIPNAMILKWLELPLFFWCRFLCLGGGGQLTLTDQKKISINKRSDCRFLRRSPGDQ